MSDYEFKVCSYSHWAMIELTLYFYTHPQQLPEQTIFEFMKRMEALSTLRNDNPNIFSVAFSVSCDIWCDVINERF